MNDLSGLTISLLPFRKRYKKEIIIAIVVLCITLLGVSTYAYSSLDKQAVFKAYNIYKKEVLKTERDKITQKIQAIDDKLAISASGTTTSGN